MKKILFILVILAIVVGFDVLTAGAQDVNSNIAVTNINSSAVNGVDAGLLPDSPFYFLKSLWEKVRETFTLRSEAKLQYMERLGEKRAVEAERMIEKGKTQQAEKVMDRYQQRLQKMDDLIQRKGEKLDAKLDAAETRIKNRFEHRNQVLQGVLDKAPEQARPGLQKALDNSKKQLQNLGTRIQDQIKRRDQRNEQLRLRINQNINVNQ
jgi:type VI protein secretion system component VasK